jgi:hypothetical protein
MIDIIRVSLTILTCKDNNTIFFITEIRKCGLYKQTLNNNIK